MSPFYKTTKLSYILKNIRNK